MLGTRECFCEKWSSCLALTYTQYTILLHPTPPMAFLSPSPPRPPVRPSPPTHASSSYYYTLIKKELEKREEHRRSRWEADWSRKMFMNARKMKTRKHREARILINIFLVASPSASADMLFVRCAAAQPSQHAR